MTTAREDSWCDACEKWTPDAELAWWFGELICEECVEEKWNEGFNPGPPLSSALQNDA